MLHLWIVAAAVVLAPLPVPNAPTTGLRDVSLEGRCDALKQFVKNFAATHLTDTVYAESGCAEGNGLGGARYSLDFKLGKEKNVGKYRLDIAFGESSTVRVGICDTNESPSVCSTNRPGEPLHFQQRGERMATADEANAAAAAFNGKGAKVSQLLPTVAAWASLPQTKHLIFGQDYAAFLTEHLKYTGAYPVQEGDKPAMTKFALRPVNAKNPGNGKVTFADPVTQSVLECFKCKDAACLNGSVVYRFEDRFLSLSREVPAEGAAKAKGQNTESVGAGWIISSKAPLTDGGWKYICGASRYSLQNVDL